VNFYGPIYVCDSRRKNARRMKSYVALFICMVIKAVHLEMISDMTRFSGHLNILSVDVGFIFR